VEGNESDWTVPPFQARIEKDWFYARGAGDMKAGIIAFLIAYKVSISSIPQILQPGKVKFAYQNLR
jgi:succinyl-diaminopimelate desuccinylase